MTKAKLTTLVSFNGSNGSGPVADLIADAEGNLYGTTEFGGAYGDGAVFEIAKTSTGYASTPTLLASFNDADGRWPIKGLIADADGNLYGTASWGGASDDGTVFEIAKTSTGYASTPTVLVNFNGADGAYPEAVLITDAAGDLFGTTGNGGAYNGGAVFKIAKTSTGYASTATVLASFEGAHGQNPNAGLIADASGDLFGTTYLGGAHDKGTVFEIAKTSTGYASTPTVLASFNGADGKYPWAGALIADAAGDLFGTTRFGGAYNMGAVFEIVKTSTGYASTPTVLASFDGADGQEIFGGLIADAAGDLFGTTRYGGINGDGTVFEIAKTESGYASTPTVVVNFSGSDGQDLKPGLIADAAGNLFGTTWYGGAYGDGTVFEVSNAGFQVNIPTGGIDLASLGYESSYKAVWRPASHLLQIKDTANADAVVATLSIAGTLTGGLVTLSNDSGTGTIVGFTPDPLVSVAPGDVVVSNIPDRFHSAHERIYQDGVLEGTDYFATDVTGETYTSKAVRYDADGALETSETANTNGSYTLKGHQDGLTLEATEANETLIGGGANETFWVSSTYQGVHEILKDFASHLTGPGADILSLPGASFNDSFAQVLAATTFSSSGATIYLSHGSHDTVQIPGLTETAMTTNSADFTFHA